MLASTISSQCGPDDPEDDAPNDWETIGGLTVFFVMLDGGPVRWLPVKSSGGWLGANGATQQMGSRDA